MSCTSYAHCRWAGANAPVAVSDASAAVTPNTGETHRRTPWCIAHRACLTESPLRQSPTDVVCVHWQASPCKVGSATARRSTFGTRCGFPSPCFAPKDKRDSTAAAVPPWPLPSGIAAAEDQQMATAVEIFNRLLASALQQNSRPLQFCDPYMTCTGLAHTAVGHTPRTLYALDLVQQMKPRNR